MSPEVPHNFIASFYLCSFVGRHWEVTGGFDQAITLGDVVVHDLALDGVSDVVPPVTHWTVVLQGIRSSQRFLEGRHGRPCHVTFPLFIGGQTQLLVNPLLLLHEVLHGVLVDLQHLQQVVQAADVLARRTLFELYLLFAFPSFFLIFLSLSSFIPFCFLSSPFCSCFISFFG